MKKNDGKKLFLRFKPCYKWNTFNTIGEDPLKAYWRCFKPCYKWNTFNTFKAMN